MILSEIIRNFAKFTETLLSETDRNLTEISRNRFKVSVQTLLRRDKQKV